MVLFEQKLDERCWPFAPKHGLNKEYVECFNYIFKKKRRVSWHFPEEISHRKENVLSKFG